MGKDPRLMNLTPHRFSVAPMMDWTDRHCRAFHRTLTRHALLYTEMVTVGAIIHGDKPRHLDFSAQEQPLALQLGGSHPQQLADCAKIAEQWGYDEVNLNCGCPSDRVQNGAFGACLMAEPKLVAECVKAMKQAVKIPVTVKCRVGIDDQNGEQSLDIFVEHMRDAGVDAVILHARKAWLKGLSPKENREIPPLQYDRVLRLKAKFPQLPIMINGGITSLEAGLPFMENLEGVMLGRAAYQEPWRLLEVDQLFFNAPAPHANMKAAIEAYYPYIEEQMANGARLSHITRHMLGAFHGVGGARAYRRHLSENAVKPTATVQVLKDAVAMVA